MDNTDFLSEGVKTKSKFGFDSMMRKMINNILAEFVIPWLGSCLTRYSEADFHARMNNPNFSFIQDWKDNHGDKYTRFIKTARKMRNRFDFDTITVTGKVVAILTKNGWTVQDHEILKLKDTVETVKKEIYD